MRGSAADTMGAAASLNADGAQEGGFMARMRTMTSAKKYEDKKFEEEEEEEGTHVNTYVCTRTYV